MRLTKKPVQLLIHLAGMRALEKAATRPTWKTVWSAGQSVGLVHEVRSCDEIMRQFVEDYTRIVQSLPGVTP